MGGRLSETVTAGVLRWTGVEQRLGVGGASACLWWGGVGVSGQASRLLQMGVIGVAGGGIDPGYKASWCLQEPTDLGHT